MPGLSVSYAHLRILVVEDDSIIADDMKGELQKMGVLVIGPASSVAAALRLLDAALVVDGAILDIDLQGEMSFPIADALRERAIPFVYATGQNPTTIPEAYQSVPRFAKSANVREVVKAVLA
jgi:CheY-like chemotaxis protein